MTHGVLLCNGTVDVCVCLVLVECNELNTKSEIIAEGFLLTKVLVDILY